MRNLEPARRPGGGFTLVEVILAVAILAIGLSILVVTASRCIGVIRRARDLETARRLIGRADLEYPIIREELQEGEEDGDFDGGPDGFSWRRTVVPIGEEDRGLFEVSLRVTWSDSGTEAFEEVASVIFAPEAASGRATP